MFTDQQRAQALGGVLQDEKSFARGIYRGYRTLICMEGKSYVLKVLAHSDADTNNAQLLSFIQQLMAENKRTVTYTAVTEYSCSLTLVVATAKKLVEVLNTLGEKLFDFLENGGYKTGCINCGEDSEDVGCYTINGTPVMMCTKCVAELDVSMQEEKNRLSGRNSDLISGTVGAVLGAVLGIIVFVIIAKLGYISALGGVAMAVCCLKGYELLGKCMDKKGIIASVIVMVLAVYVANQISWAWEMYDVLKEYDYTFFECFAYHRYLLKDIFECYGDFIKDTVLAYVFTGIGSAGVIINAFKSATGSYKIEKIG